MRKYLLIIAIVGSMLFVSAQEYKIGVYAEPSVGWLNPMSRKVQNNATALGFGGGITVDYFFAENYAFATGIGLSTQGGSLHYADSVLMHVYDESVQSSSDVVVKYKLNYLNIPFGIKLKTNQIGYLTYFFDLGFDLQVSLSARAVSDKDFYFDDETRFLDNDPITKDVNFMNISWHTGAGFEYEISESTNFFTGLIYRNGFTDITAQESMIYSRVVALRIGILF